ncbi:hypothetical protein V1280_004282 [Bradyrhizobium sp. AZCC 2230]
MRRSAVGWAKRAETWREVKGVAGRTVARLHAELPEIGILSNKAIAKLTGLAPIANDSGKRKGKRPTRGGREGVRSILFLVAATAPATTKASPTSATGWSPPERKKWSFAWRSPASFSSVSTPKLAMRVPLTPMQLDSRDSRSSRPAPLRLSNLD